MEFQRGPEMQFDGGARRKARRTKVMAGREYKQRAEYKQIWPIYIGILTKTTPKIPKNRL